MVVDRDSKALPRDLTLAEIYEALGSDLPPTDLLAKLLAQLVEVDPYVSCAVLREEETWSTISFVASAGEYVDCLRDVLVGERPRPWQSVRVLALQRRFLCAPSEIFYGVVPQELDEGMRCIILPIGSETRGRSALVVLARATAFETFMELSDSTEVEPLEIFCRTIAQVLERLDAKDLQTTLRRRVLITETLTSALANVAISLESWLSLVARCTLDVVSCGEVRLIFCEGLPVLVVTAQVGAEVHVEYRDTVPPGLADYVVKSGHDVLAGSLQYGLIEPREAQYLASVRHRSQSVVVTPLREVDGSVWGGIGGIDRGLCRFNQESLNALREVAQVASAGIRYRSSHLLGLLEADRNRSLAKALDQIGDGVVIVGSGQRLIYANQTALELFGYSLEEITAIPSMQLIDERDRDKVLQGDLYEALHRGEKIEVDLLSLRKNGEVFLGSYAIVGQRSTSGNIIGWTCNLRDYTERAAIEDGLRREAEVDHLTSALSRRGFVTRVERFLTEHRDHDSYISLIYVDLNGFKSVNDSYGHAAGDELLRVVANRLRGGLKDSDLLGRLGGDEFVVALVDLASARDGHTVAKRLEQRLNSSEVVVNGQRIFVTASLGIASSKVAKADVDVLVHRADQAMYRVKHGRSVTSEASKQSQIDARLAEDLRHALSVKDRVRADLRPRINEVISVPDRIPVGHLLDVDWDHPERGPIPLQRVLSVVSDAQLATKLDRLAIDAISSFLDNEAPNTSVVPPEIFLSLQVDSLMDAGFTRMLVRAYQRWHATRGIKATVLLGGRLDATPVDARFIRHCSMLVQSDIQVGLSTPFLLPHFLNSLDRVPLHWVQVKWNQFNSTNVAMVKHFLQGVTATFSGIGAQIFVVDVPRGQEDFLHSIGIRTIVYAGDLTEKSS